MANHKSSKKKKNSVIFNLFFLCQTKDLNLKLNQFHLIVTLYNKY